MRKMTGWGVINSNQESYQDFLMNLFLMRQNTKFYRGILQMEKFDPYQFRNLEYDMKNNCCQQGRK